MNQIKTNKCQLSLAVCAVLFSFTSSAEQTKLQQAEGDELEVIEVRGTPMTRYYVREATAATKIASDIMEIPRAVTLIPEQVIIDQQSTNLEDVLRNVSGVSREHSQGGQYNHYSLRGFSTRTTFRDGFPSVPSLVSTATIESLEVLKGPASVLYGSVQPGGVVNVVTKKPKAEDYHLLHSSFDEHGKKYLLGDSTGALNGDASLLYRVVASAENSDLFRDDITTKRVLFSPSLSWYFNDDSLLNVNLEYQDDKQPVDRGIIASFQNNDPTKPITQIDTDYSKTYLEEFDYSDSNVLSLTADFTTSLDNGWALTSKFSALRSESDSLQTRPTGTVHGYQVYINSLQVGDLTPLAGLGLAPADDGTLLRMVSGYTGKQDVYYGGVNLDKSLSLAWSEHKILLGGEWRTEDSTSTRRDGESQALNLRYDVFAAQSAVAQQDFVTAAAIARGIYDKYFGFNVYSPEKGLLSSALSDVGFDYENSSDTYGLYVQDQIELSEQFIVLAGMRYDYFKGSVKTDRNGTGVDSAGQHSDSEMSYQFGALYRLNDQSSFYASYSESFTPQSFGNLTHGNDSDAKPLLTPERGKQTEIGAKFNWLDDKLTMTLAYYDIEKRNILSYIPSVEGGVIPTLIGAITSTGVELDVTAQLDKGLNLIASWSKLDPEITDTGEGSVDNAGNRPNNVADETASLWLSYEPKISGNASWGIAGGVYYSGDRFGDNANSWSLGSYTTAELGVWYYLPIASDQLKLHLSVKNISDKKYLLSSANAKEQITPGQPRTVNLSLSWMF